MDKYADKSKFEKTRTPQKAQKITEIRFHKNITEHDLHTKLKKIETALSKKNQVRLRLQLLGREKAHPKHGAEWLTGIVEKFSDISTVNKQPTPDNLVVILFPKK